MSVLPLGGVRILDLGQVIAMPFCTQWLAWMGAEVNLVESRRHFTSRVTPPFHGGPSDPDASGHFNLLNGAKRSCTVDISRPEGRELVLRLVAVSDVIVDNFATGVIERLGFGYDTVRELRPDIIMLSIGAFGRSGPMKDAIGFHSAVNLFSGVADVTGYRGGRPRIMGGVIPDPLSGAYAAFAILAALHHRRRTGEGQYIDGAMYEAMLSLIPEAVIDFTLNGQAPVRIGNGDRGCAPHGIFRCRGDDAWVAVTARTDDQWSALCRVIGQEQWTRDPRFGSAELRVRQQDELNAGIGAWTRDQTPRAATEILQQAGVAAGPVLGPDELFDDPQLRHRGFIVDTEHPKSGAQRQTGVPWQIEGVSPAYLPAPLLGSHTHDVLVGLAGIHEHVYAAHAASGVLA